MHPVPSNRSRSSPRREHGAGHAADARRGEYLPDQTFLRGRQETDTEGLIEFPTGGAPAILDVTPDERGYRAAICLIVSTTTAPA